MAEETAPKAGGSDAEQNKAMAAIAYLGILFLIPLLAAKNSPFAQYHARQGLVLFIVEIIAGVVGVIPFIGWVVSPIIGILVLVLFIMGLMNALSGKTQPLPVIGSFGEKLKI